MFFCYILKNMKRSAVTNALFCLLLALAGALFALSAGLWYSVYMSEQNLDNAMTTIAIPDMLSIRRHVKSLATSDNLSGFTDETGRPLEQYRETFGIPEQFQSFVTPHINRQIMERISENVYHSGYVLMDDRRIYGAYIDGVQSVPFHITEYRSTDTYVENSLQSIVAFIVTCTGVEEVFQWTQIDQGRALIRSIVADFVVEQDYVLHHGRQQLLQTATGFFPYMNPDGSFPVEEGKRYIVMGYQYSQGGNMLTSNPDWYDALPPGRNMPFAMYVDVLGKEHEMTEAYTAYSLSDISENIRPLMGAQGVTARSYPITVFDRIPLYDPELCYEGYTWFELSGSLEDALASEQGEFISAVLSVAEVSCNSLTVITTNDINSFLRFNQRTNKIVAGRSFNADDIGQNSRVCVISEQLAEVNGLAIGDMLDMRMYITALGQSQYIVYTRFSSYSTTAWFPNAYHPLLELTNPLEYEIVGTYSGLVQEQNDHAISANTVFIPASSFSGIPGSPVVRMDKQYDPPLLNTIIVPNGKVEETKAMIDGIADGYSSYFRFYDQGYSAFKPVLANLRFGMAWIALLAAAGWTIAVVIFSMFYIGRKKKEAVLLSSIGVSKGKCLCWISMQCAIIAILAQGIVLITTVLLFDTILENVISVATKFTEAYRDFSLSEMRIVGGMQIALPLDSTPLGLILTAVVTAVLLLAIACVLSAHAVKKSRA